MISTRLNFFSAASTLQTIATLVVVWGATISFGCGDPSNSNASKGKSTGSASSTKSTDAGTKSAGGGDKLRVGMIAKLDIPYFQACRKGAEEACLELGYDFDYFAFRDVAVAQQVATLDQWTAQGFDMIVVAPNDPQQIEPAISRAKEQGITVVTFDADAKAGSKRDAFCNQATTQAIGEMLVDLLAEQIGGKGKALIVSSTPYAPNQNAWMAIMKPYLKKKYPEITLLADLMPGEDQNKCREMTLAAINAEADLKGIWGLTSKALPGAAEAVRQTKKSGAIAVTGLGLPAELKQYVHDGTVKKFALWNPVDLGYLAVRSGAAIREKTFKEGAADFGRLKKINVVGSEVILGPPAVFDKTNVDSASF